MACHGCAIFIALAFCGCIRPYVHKSLNVVGERVQFTRFHGDGGGEAFGIDCRGCEFLLNFVSRGSNSWQYFHLSKWGLRFQSQNPSGSVYRCFEGIVQYKNDFVEVFIPISVVPYFAVLVAVRQSKLIAQVTHDPFDWVPWGFYGVVKTFFMPASVQKFKNCLERNCRVLSERNF